VNDMNRPPSSEAPQSPSRPPQEDIGVPLSTRPRKVHRYGQWSLVTGALLLLVGALAQGVWRHHAQHLQVIRFAEQQADFVPEVGVERVMQRIGAVHVTLPGTTLAFEQANVYARASGYVLKRFVDIGDHVKAGQLLAVISAPEVEDQVAQYQNSLAQAIATQLQNDAQRSSTHVTSTRSSILARDGWDTQEQGDVDRYNYQAQQHATDAAQFGAAALQAQLKSVNQQKIYQQVVAPFSGVITKRNIDVGSLIAADAVSGTAMFSMDDSDVIRVWVYVPQDDAFGVKPGVEATVRVPDMPNLTFHGKVTRIADALEPGTRTLLTEVDVPNLTGTLSPGIYCTVELDIPRTSPALIVPASAIIFDQEGMQVAVANNGRVYLHKIAITTDFGTEVQVNEGVKPGDKIILQPPVNLYNGEAVKISQARREPHLAG
jgi:RND family efflux transporter MFP subunit